MKVSFEFTTENENRSTMLLVAEFCNALARNVAQPVLSSTVEPGTEKQPIKTVAEIIAEERAKTASMKKKAPAVEEPEQISEETAAEAEKPKQKSRNKAEAVAKRTEEKEAAEKLEAERQAETDRLTAEAAKLEAKRVAEAAAKEAAAKEAAAKEAAAKEAAAPEQTPLTIKDCRDLAMQALNKQRKDLIQEAFAKVGCPNFPALEKKPEMFDTFMEHIKSGLNE
jgi:type IV secretory pathway VirB10-like protein